MKTQEAKNREKDKRLWDNYRWTLERRNRLAEKQGYRCAICGRHESEFKYGLVLDHRHFKVITQRTNLNEVFPKGWVARVDEFQLTEWGKTKAQAVAAVREKALPVAVRGLLCPGRHGKAGHGCCNRLLGRVDDIDWLRKSASYLENPPAKQVSGII